MGVDLQQLGHLPSTVKVKARGSRRQLQRFVSLGQSRHRKTILKVLSRFSDAALGPAKIFPDDPDLAVAPPTMWIEVFSRADCTWLPIDPIRAIVNKRKVFDPGYSNLPKKGEKVRNRMLYVLAFEEDSFARDVTARYAKDYGAKIVKMQRSGGVGNSRKEWWDRIVAMVQRPYRLVTQ